MRIPIVSSLLIRRLAIMATLLLVQYANAQKLEIHGIIYDSETQKTLSEVNIVTEDKSAGCYTDNNGMFSIPLKKLPCKLLISHIGYKSEEISVSEQTKLYSVKLSREITPLESVSISSSRIRNMVENQKLYIIDYMVNKDSILLLCYNKRHLKEAQIVLINENNRIITRKNIQHITRFEEDYRQNFYIIGKNTAREVVIENKLIELKKEWKLEDYNKVQKAIIAYSKPIYYLRQNIADNQIIKLYTFNEISQKLELFKTIVDEAGLERLSDKNRLQSAANYTPADARFEEMCFYAPKYIPMIFKNKLFYLFNFEEDNIEIIDTNGQELRSIDIEFHHQRHWKKQLLHDKVTGTIYAVFEKNGFYKIAEIDTKNGVLKEQIEIPKFVYIEKIKVNNGKVYFLYKGNVSNKYKELYCMDL
jgi:hypothetical protein